MHIMKKKTATEGYYSSSRCNSKYLGYSRTLAATPKSNSSKHAENQIDGIISPAYEDAFTLEATAIGLMN